VHTSVGTSRLVPLTLSDMCAIRIHAADLYLFHEIFA
jgi:hypothetical protein